MTLWKWVKHPARALIVCAGLLLVFFQNMAPYTKGEVLTRLRPITPPPFTTKTAADFRLLVQNKSTTQKTYMVRAYHLYGTTNTSLGFYNITLAPQQKIALFFTSFAGFAVGTNTIRYQVLEGSAVIHSKDEVFTNVLNISGTDRTVDMAQAAWIDSANLLPGILKRTRNLSYTGTNPVEDHIRKLVLKLKQAHIRTLIISYPEFNGVYYYPMSSFLQGPTGVHNDFDVSLTANQLKFWAHPDYWCAWKYGCGAAATSQTEKDIPATNLDLMEILFSAADANDVSIFVGTGRDGDTHLTNDLYAVKMGNTVANYPGVGSPAARSLRAINLSYMKAQDMHFKYGHHKSFHGWYISHEVNDLESGLRGFYNDMAKALKLIAPEMPVMVAPANDPTLFTSLDVAQLLKDGWVDIYAYQDSVGVGLSAGAQSWNPANRVAELNAFYAKLRSFVDNANATVLGTERPWKRQLWSVTEIWRMDGSCHLNSSHYCGSFPTANGEQVDQQIAIARKYVDRISLNEASGFIEPANMPLQLTADANNLLAGPCRVGYSACPSYGGNARAFWTDYLARLPFTPEAGYDH